MAACLLFACKPAPSAESLLGAAPLPSYGLADFAVHPGLGVPVGKRHLIAMFTDTADGPAIADALAQAGVTIAGGQSEPPIAFVTVPDDRGWDGLDAAHAALAAHPAVAAVAHDLVLASTHAPPPRGASHNNPGNAWLDTIGARQAWNAIPALRWIHSQQQRTVTIGMIDTDYQSHPDLAGVLSILSPEPGPADTSLEAWHGSFDAGLIGAKWNGSDIDGVVPQPFARILGVSASMLVDATLPRHSEAVATSGGMVRGAVQQLLQQTTPPRLLSYSMGYNWNNNRFRQDCDGIACWFWTAGDTPTMCDPSGVRPMRCDARRVRTAIEDQGRLLASLLRWINARRPMLMFCSAGNDAATWPGFPARLSSPCASAALHHGVTDIVVVGSHAPVPTTLGPVTEHPGSNLGSDLLAPGVNIESLRATRGVQPLTGTSQATPIAAGAAALLLALNPSLSNLELKRLLILNTTQVTQPDGSVRDRPVLHLRRAVEAMTVQIPGGAPVSGAKLLADIDDGSDDGFTREPGRQPKPRDWTRVRIDMRDMRAFRDLWWLTRSDPAATLRCPGSVRACDLNGDGSFAAPSEPYSRAALVGPDVDDAALAAFEAQWEGDDRQAFARAELRDLLYSADLKVDGRAFLLQARTSVAVDGLRVSFSGGQLPGGGEARHAAISGIVLSDQPHVLTTTGLRAPAIEVQATHGGAPVGRVYRASFPDLSIAEDRTLVLNPCAWDSEPEISILEPWTTMDCDDDETSLVHENHEFSDREPGTLRGDKASSRGEPHLQTFDGLYYDFQGAGEFTLFRDGTLEVQARQEPLRGLGDVSGNTMVATRVGADRLVVRRGQPDRVWVNGEERALSGELVLPGGTVTRAGNTLTLTWSGGDQLRCTVLTDLIDIDLGIQRRPGRAYSGLLGTTPNGDPDDDLVARDGTRHSQPSQRALYREFGESWRVAQADSLLDYGPGESTATFTDRDFPTGPTTLADLAPAALAAAHARCSEAGIRQPALLDACTLDVALLRRDDAAFSFRGVPDPRASFRPAHTRVDFEASVLGLFTDPLARNPLVPPIQRAPGVQPWPATRFFGPFTARDQPADAPLALFNDLPPHDQLELSFDLLVLGDWRGDAVLEVRSLGRVLSRATYSTGDAHQSFPGAPPQADYPGGTAALARDVLGLGGRDAVFRHHLVFPHSDPTLIVQWLAHGVGGDNRWGIDNVELVTRTYSGHREPVEVVAGVMTTLEHGPPLPPEQAGCADGTREAFHDLARHPDRAGCVAAWTDAADLAARPTGAACGDALGPCAAPADACAAGWHVCGAGGDLAELRSLDPVTCSRVAGEFLGASSVCAGDDPCVDPPATGLTCAGDGDCARAFCCGSDFFCSDLPPGCGFSATRLTRGPEPCAHATSRPGRGVLCCRG